VNFLLTTENTEITEDHKMSKLIYETETYNLLGACFEVYKEKGCGFLEAVYQECLEMELCDRKVDFEARRPLQLSYKGRPLKQAYEPDFLCYGKIIIEIKAVKELTDEHRAQVINYLKATGVELGLLVNFGKYPKVQHERFLNTRN